jgi:hypothetical protein
LIVRQREVLRRLSGAGYERALARVSAAERDDYESAGILSWCNQVSARSVTKAVATELGLDPLQLAGDVVAESVREALRGPWGILIGRMIDDRAIVMRASMLFEKAFDQDKLQASLLGPGQALLRLSGWQGAEPIDIVSVARRAEALLQSLGRRASVTYQVRGDEIEFNVISGA